jgi:3,4-dihydroxy 2-butanone 4-phosphate synthase/GTP cyclohydrolase II
MRLLTNNPIKRRALMGYGLEITERIPLEVEPNKYNAFYMHTKKERMGHDLHLS